MRKDEEYKCPDCGYKLSALHKKKGLMFFCDKCKWKDPAFWKFEDILADGG